MIKIELDGVIAKAPILQDPGINAEPTRFLARGM